MINLNGAKIIRHLPYHKGGERFAEHLSNIQSSQRDERSARKQLCSVRHEELN